MHLIGVRASLVKAHPWLPVALLKAFTASKDVALDRLADMSASKVTLPFVEEHLRSATDLMGTDFWPYGLEANQVALDYFLQRHHAQGISGRLVAADELFDPSTHEHFRL